MNLRTMKMIIYFKKYFENTKLRRGIIITIPLLIIGLSLFKPILFYTESLALYLIFGKDAARLALAEDESFSQYQLRSHKEAISSLENYLSVCQEIENTYFGRYDFSFESRKSFSQLSLLHQMRIAAIYLYHGPADLAYEAVLSTWQTHRRLQKLYEEDDINSTIRGGRNAFTEDELPLFLSTKRFFPFFADTEEDIRSYIYRLLKIVMMEDAAYCYWQWYELKQSQTDSDVLKQEYPYWKEEFGSPRGILLSNYQKQPATKPSFHQLRMYFFDILYTPLIVNNEIIDTVCALYYQDHSK